MKILILPDSFKGSLSAIDFCNIVSKAILDIDPSAKIEALPVADGGEGTVDALLDLDNSQKITIPTIDALGRPIEAYYGYFANSKTAIIEMAAASGLCQIESEKRNPFIANTKGTGIMIKHAIDNGAKKLIIGLGGSATNDAGAGCLAALGFEFLDKNNQPLNPNNSGLSQLHSIKTPNYDFSQIDIQVACDINNPLCGKFGASYVFARQKGAKEEDLEPLDLANNNFSEVVKKDLGLEIADIPGAGAAGGMGAGLQLIGGKLASGFTIISDFLDLPGLMQKEKFDLVITGEGEFNTQSQYGKVPVSVAKLAKKYNYPVIAICGGLSVDNKHIIELGIDASYSICNKPMSLESAIVDCDKLLYQAAQNIYNTLLISKSINS